MLLGRNESTSKAPECRLNLCMHCSVPSFCEGKGKGQSLLGMKEVPRKDVNTGILKMTLRRVD